MESIRHEAPRVQAYPHPLPVVMQYICDSLTSNERDILRETLVRLAQNGYPERAPITLETLLTTAAVLA